MRSTNNRLTRSQRRGSRYFTVNSAQHHTTRTNWDSSSIKVQVDPSRKVILSRLCRFDYEHEHRPPRRTEHEHDEQPEPSVAPKSSIVRF